MKKKFLPAFRGLWDAAHERSVQIQMILGAVTVCFGIFLSLDKTEWLAVIILIGCVISAEIFNAVCEKLCDLYTKEKCEEIRVIKDMAAGAVLGMSIAALAAAAVIFLPKIIGRIME